MKLEKIILVFYSIGEIRYSMALPVVGMLLSNGRVSSPTTASMNVGVMQNYPVN